MTTPQRRSLLAGLESHQPTPPPAPEITEAAARHGFAVTAATAANGTDNQAAGRQRQKIGRDQPFSVRLRGDTRAAIYAQANGRNVPVAQVIEEAMAALEANLGRS